jgi:hypothetical protein
MPQGDVGDPGLVALMIALVFVPGLVVGFAGGLRRWSLAGCAPLLTYGLAGLLGPWTTAAGIGWSGAVLAAGTLVIAGVVAGLRLLGRRDGVRDDAEPRWSRIGSAGVAAAVGVAAVVGATAIVRGMGGLATIPQDWDAVFHADGVRYIATTGDAGLFGMSTINWYEPGTQIFYPNAYHLIGAVARQVTQAGLPAVLNAHTVLIPGVAALVLAAFVRRLGAPPVHAAGTALSVAGMTVLYDMLWRGPLLPYAAGVIVTPAFVVLVVGFLDARGRGARLGGGSLLALGIAGLICLHPAMLFGAAVLGVAYLAWRWLRRPRALRSEPLLLIAAGIAGLGLSFLQIGGSLYSAASFPPVDWPAITNWQGALRQLVTFEHAAPTMQVWPAVLALLGLLALPWLGELRWVVVPLAVFGALFVATASSDAPWVQTITRPWWNDRYRLIAVFALLACVLIGHALSMLHRVAVAALRLASARIRPETPLRRAPQVAIAALVLATFFGVTHGLYLSRNEAKMSRNTGGPAVSPGEVVAYQELGRIVPPGTRVLNDRYDGSVWMYALDGVLPVAGHYDATGLGPTDVGLLETRFNAYASDPAVRAAVRRLDVEYLMVGQGFLRGDSQRAAGLTALDGAPYLTAVYRSPEAVIYRIDAG